MKIVAVIILIILVFFPILATASQQSYEYDLESKYDVEIYDVKTEDDSSITLTRYVGCKRPSIILIHGMGSNHLSFDWDENHSLARFLAKDGFDVWLLDLRTHDADGDFFFDRNCNREKICRYWDFDNTYVKIDTVTAIEFIKNKTGFNKVILSGHSIGGYVAYAYAQLLGEEDLAGIIAIASSPYADPRFPRKTIDFFHFVDKFGFRIGKRAYVRPFGLPFKHLSKFRARLALIAYEPHPDIFYNYATPEYIQKKIFYHSDSEPAGVCVDMFYGKDPELYDFHWVDPQTLYDYSINMYKITVPILFIAGDEDPQDPKVDIYSAYLNVSSTVKEFYSFSKHSHMDLLLGDDASTLIFPNITNWLNNLPS